MRVLVAEDSALIRAGISEVLAVAGHEVIGQAADADELRRLVADLAATTQLPDLVITDVRMPPTGTDDGLRVAIDLRTEHPGLAVMVVSAYVSGPYVRTLLADTRGGGIGYLLKDRVGQVADFLASLEVVASGGVCIDPEVVTHGMAAASPGPADRLTDRERQVMQLMAEGLSNTQIEARLHLSRAAVAKHVASVFLKLDLPPGQDNRRVRAVLIWLDHHRQE